MKHFIVYILMSNKAIFLLHSPWIELCARLLLAALFLYACIHKILHPDQFARIIYGYQILPGWAVNAAALIMPYVELVAGLSLLLGIFPRAGALLISGMLFIFILAIGFNLARGLEFDCGCFSVGHKNRAGEALELLIRDIALLGVSGLVLFFKYPRKGCLLPESSA